MQRNNYLDDVPQRSRCAAPSVDRHRDLQHKRQQKNKWQQNYRMKMRMRLLKEEEETRVVQGPLIRVLRAMVNDENHGQQKDDDDVEPCIIRRSPRKRHASLLSSPTLANVNQGRSAPDGKTATGELVPPCDRPSTSSTNTVNDAPNVNDAMPPPTAAGSTPHTAGCQTDVADSLTRKPTESTPKMDGPSRLESKLDEQGNKLNEIATDVAQLKTAMQSIMDAITRLTEQQMSSSRAADTSSVANSSVHSVESVAGARERLTYEQRSIFRRRPMVSSDEEHEELIRLLEESGRDGPFFSSLVRTLADRLTNKSDANKTANAVLRALYDEMYLADRVTMAGYKKCNFNESNRDYGEPERRYFALGGSMIFWAIFHTIKFACRAETTDEKIKKSIRDGVNTLRLHDKDRRKRQNKAASQAHCSYSGLHDNVNEIVPEGLRGLLQSDDVFFHDDCELP